MQSTWNPSIFAVHMACITRTSVSTRLVTGHKQIRYISEEVHFQKDHVHVLNINKL